MFAGRFMRWFGLQRSVEGADSGELLQDLRLFLGLGKRDELLFDVAPVERFVVAREAKSFITIRFSVEQMRSLSPGANSKSVDRSTAS